MSQEFCAILNSGRIDKITAPNFFSVRFAIFANGKTHGLVINASPDKAHMRLTDGLRVELPSTSVFVAHLKKHILKGVISKIECVDNERIIKLYIDTKNDLLQEKKFILVAELTGKHSNMMLLTGELKISESLKHIPLDVSTVRQILPGIKYTDPPTQDKISIFDKLALTKILSGFTGNSQNELAIFLKDKLLGLAPKTITEFCARSFKVLLKKENATTLANKLHATANNFVANLEPCFSINSDNKPTDFYASKFVSISDKTTKTNLVNNAIDAVYGYSEITSIRLAYERKITQNTKQALSRAQKRLSTLIERQNDAFNLEKDRICGELIVSNLYKIKPLDTSLICDNFYVTPPIPITIKFDDGMSAKKMAEKYFKAYQKKKKTLVAIEPQIADTQKEVDYLKSILDCVNIAETKNDLDEIFEELVAGGFVKSEKIKAKKSKSKIKTEKEERLANVSRQDFLGYTILTGKNNLQNDGLIRYCSPNDMWFHPQEFRGAHTVVLNPKKTALPDKLIREAAKINAHYSKAKNSTSIPIDYTYLKFVLRPRGAPLGKVIYTNQKTIFIDVD